MTNGRGYLLMLSALATTTLVGTAGPPSFQATLTRLQAQRVINASAVFTSVRSIVLLEKAHENGVTEGLFARPDYWSFTLTSEGQKFFVLQGGGILALQPGGPGYSGALVNLPVQARREVLAVTGITSEGTGLQRVLFRWKYVGLSEVVTRYAGQGANPHEGIAILRLYDDGWRLERIIELKETGRVPFRFDQVLVQKANAARKAQADFELGARTPTRILGNVELVGRGNMMGAQSPVLIQVSNVNVVFRQPAERIAVGMGEIPYSEVAYVGVEDRGTFGFRLRVSDERVKSVSFFAAPDHEAQLRALCNTIYDAVSAWKRTYQTLQRYPLNPSGCGGAERLNLADEGARRERERVAKTPTRTIASFRTVSTEPDVALSVWLVTTTVDVEITDVGLRLTTTRVNAIDQSHPSAFAFRGRQGSASGPESTILGYWQAKEFRVESHRTRTRSYTDLVADIIGGRSYPIRQGSDGRVDLDKMLELIRTAHSEWNAKFPDRLNWFPAGVAGGTPGSLVAPAKVVPSVTIRASHILLKLQGKDEAAVRRQAEELVKLARGGADFAELARKFSEDEATRAAGGDLGYFGSGLMVPEFDKAVLALRPGQVSDVVRTSYGLHVIKVFDRREELR